MTDPLPRLTGLVPAELDGQPLSRVLRALVPGSSWSRLKTAIATGKVRVDGVPKSAPSEPVAAGALVELNPNAPRPTALARLSRQDLVYVDRDLVVVRKPAGINSVPFEAGEPGSLAELVRTLLSRIGSKGHAEPALGVVHRIDRETTGLLVFARNLASKRELERQFRRHTIERRYLALALGAVGPGTLRSRLVKDRGDGRRGCTDNPRLGREAITHVRPIERLPGVTLIECRLETGRTHQIRIQLAEARHPLLGERVYADPRDLPRLGAPRLMLHAAVLGFAHPRTAEAVRFEEPLPGDMQVELERLRKSESSGS